MGVISITWSSATITTVTSELSPPQADKYNRPRYLSPSLFNFLPQLFSHFFSWVELSLMPSLSVFSSFPSHYSSLSLLYSSGLFPFCFFCLSLLIHPFLFPLFCFFVLFFVPTFMSRFLIIPYLPDPFSAHSFTWITFSFIKLIFHHFSLLSFSISLLYCFCIF